MRLVIGSDHAGWPLKQTVIDHIRSLGHDIVDVGSHDDKPVDFPDIAREVARKVTSGEAERGIMVCGTGVGACIASIVWFSALGFGARRLAGVFAKPAAWRVLDVLIAVTMTGLGAAMLLGRT